MNALLVIAVALLVASTQADIEKRGGNKDFCKKCAAANCKFPTCDNFCPADCGAWSGLLKRAAKRDFGAHMYGMGDAVVESEKRGSAEKFCKKCKSQGCMLPTCPMLCPKEC